MYHKTCTKCNLDLECTSENFYRNKNGKYGFSSVCKKCERADDKRYKKDNEASVKYNRKMFFVNNPSYKRDYNEKNSDKLRIQKQQYYLMNRDRMVLNSRGYYVRHREKLAEYRKEYYKNNTEKYRSYERTDRQRKLKNIRGHRYKARMKDLPNDYTSIQWEQCQNYFDNSCAYCGAKEETLTKDHFVPITKGGEFNINNIIPACGSCNSGKQDKNFFGWYPQHKTYSKLREKKILRYLNYKERVQQLSIL